MRAARRRLWLASLALAVPIASLALLLVASRPGAALGLSIGALGLGTLVALVWSWLDRTFVRPARDLANGIDLVLSGGRLEELELPPAHGLAPLPQRVAALAERWRTAQAGLEAERDRAVAASELQRRRLEAVLRDLGEGLILCAADGRILLYNDAAVDALGAPPALGLGRSLHILLPREAIVHQVGLLRRRAAESGGVPLGEPFLLAAGDGQRLLRCRLSLIGEEAPGGEGFVLALSDPGAVVESGAARDLLDRLDHAWRGPLASLLAAAELLPEELAGQRGPARELAGIIADEGHRLHGLLEALTAEARQALLRTRGFHDVRSSELIEIVGERLDERGIPVRLVPDGPPLWLGADSFMLAAALVELAARLGSAELRVAAMARPGGVELELASPGSPLAKASLDAWLDAPVAAAGAAVTAREIFRRHDGEPWVGPGRALPGAVLHLPLPGPTGVHPDRILPSLPPRPEFYDFALPASVAGDRGDQPLRALSYVVFDTETTGLDPKGADEILQLAGVRVVNGRLLQGELFDRLVDPKRPIPASSTRFHGITDAAVAGKPPVELVLAEFHRFVGDSILVAHNAAFDLAFLRKHERRAGVRFGGPVLDTLLMSALLLDHTDAHSLDRLAERFGIEIRGRHTALGDSVATARLLIRLFDLLELRGLRTLNEVIAASGRVVELRRMQAAQFGSSDHG